MMRAIWHLLGVKTKGLGLVLVHNRNRTDKVKMCLSRPKPVGEGKKIIDVGLDFLLVGSPASSVAQ